MKKTLALVPVAAGLVLFSFLLYYLAAILQ